MGEEKPVIRTGDLSVRDKRKIAWGIIKTFQGEGLSYRQAVEVLEDTKDQLKNIPIKIFNQ